MTQTTTADPTAQVLSVDQTGETLLATLHHLTFPDGFGFDIYIQQSERDEISSAIRDGRYAFPRMYDHLLRLAPAGARVLDLGAHIGTFSLHATAHGNEVMAVEASPRNATLLKASAVHNHFHNLRLINAAVSDHPGSLQFLEGGPYGLVGNPYFKDPMITVTAVRVEDVLREAGWDNVAFIKLDVEGSEPKALLGMTSLLARDDAPPILYESNAYTLRFFDESPLDIATILECFGYQRYLVVGDALQAFRPGEFVAACTVDFLAIKHMPSSIDGWVIRQPSTKEQKVEEVLATCTDGRTHERAYIARALAGQGELIAFDQRIANALDQLSEDTEPSVQEAARWWQQVSTGKDARRLRQALAEKEEENKQLQTLVRGYERGRFIRAMRAIRRLRNRFS